MRPWLLIDNNYHLGIFRYMGMIVFLFVFVVLMIGIPY